MTRKQGALSVLTLAVSAALTVASAAQAPRRQAPAPAKAAAPAAGPLQSQETNIAGVTADLTECKRKEGVLSVKVKLRNTSDRAVQIPIVHSRQYDHFYVTAESKKYLMLKDSDGMPLAPQWDAGGNLYVRLDKGGSYTWWAKYPAPPPEVKKINFVFPLSAPFEDVPITDQ